MINTLVNYQTLKEYFNQEVSDQLQMADSISKSGKSLVIQKDPIKVEIEANNDEVEVIIITSKMLKTPLYDEIFMALEKCLNCSSIKFYNAYQSAIKQGISVSAENNHVKAVHDASNGPLNVKITKVQ
ncbi:hypothetical protein [Leuconostoc mesenteroides]